MTNPISNLHSLPPSPPAPSLAPEAKGQTETEMRELFRDFVGQTLFGQLLASMHKTHSEPAYMHGGQGERVFQQQLDQEIVKEITEASASRIADPMYDLFQLNRKA